MSPITAKLFPKHKPPQLSNLVQTGTPSDAEGSYQLLRNDKNCGIRQAHARVNKEQGRGSTCHLSGAALHIRSSLGKCAHSSYLDMFLRYLRLADYRDRSSFSESESYPLTRQQATELSSFVHGVIHKTSGQEGVLKRYMGNILRVPRLLTPAASYIGRPRHPI